MGIAAMSSGSGCAYFNAFYLARKNFNDGERFRKRDNEVRMENKKDYTTRSSRLPHPPGL